MELIIAAILIITIEGFYINNFTKIPLVRRNLIFAFLVFIQIFLPAAFRHYSVYNDTLMYVEHFKLINPTNIFSIDFKHRFEYGYQLLENVIFLYVSKSTIALFLVTSFFIQLSYILFFYRNSKLLWFSIFLYLGFTHYFFTVSAVRQAIAIAIFNFAFYFLVNKKYYYYLLITVLAAQFHSSAYLLLILPLFANVHVNKKNLIIFFLLLLLSYLFLEKLLLVFYTYFSDYGKYYLNEGWISESKLGTIFIIITLLIGLIIILKKFDFKNYTVAEKYMLIFYLALLTFWVFSLKISVMARFTQYFMPVSIVLLTNSCYKIQNKLYRNYTFAFWIIFLLIQLIIILYYRPEWFMITPYKFYWQ